MVGQEVARRRIREVGIFESSDLAKQIRTLNDGKAIHTKCGWLLTTGQGLRMWAYNMGQSAIGMTDPAVNVSGHCNLWPA